MSRGKLGMGKHHAATGTARAKLVALIGGHGGKGISLRHYRPQQLRRSLSAGTSCASVLGPCISGEAVSLSSSK